MELLAGAGVAVAPVGCSGLGQTIAASAQEREERNQATGHRHIGGLQGMR